MSRMFLSDADFLRLRVLVEYAKTSLHRDREHVDALSAELSRADVVADGEVPANVVTMNSRVRVTDLDTGSEAVYTLAFPGHADAANARISVLAPIGAALLGHRAGSVVSAIVPRGTKRLRIDEVLSPRRGKHAA